jgi:single-strand DNA-binding protein
MLLPNDNEEAAVNEIYVTINGVVGSDVQLHHGERQNWTRFRLATTERYLDSGSGEWRDRDTVWMDVVCWRRLAEHVAASVSKGQPVIVRGKLRVKHWESEKGPREGLELVATSLGHDLTMGQATFTRAPKGGSASHPPESEQRAASSAPLSPPPDDPFHESVADVA